MAVGIILAHNVGGVAKALEKTHIGLVALGADTERAPINLPSVRVAGVVDVGGELVFVDIVLIYGVPAEPRRVAAVPVEHVLLLAGAEAVGRPGIPRVGGAIDALGKVDDLSLQGIGINLHDARVSLSAARGAGKAEPQVAVLGEHHGAEAPSLYALNDLLHPVGGRIDDEEALGLVDGKDTVAHAHHVAHLSAVELVVGVFRTRHLALQFQFVKVEHIYAIAGAHIAFVFIHSEEATSVGIAVAIAIY